jgi:hypothetical protein
VTRFITVTEAADEYFVPERTVRTWIARDLVHWVGTGLLDDEEVRAAEYATRRTRRMDDLLARAGIFESSSAPEPPSPHGRNMPKSG